MRAFLVAPGFERSLIEELPSGGEMIASGVVTSREDAPPDLDPVFARQVLPNAALIEAPSVAKLAAVAVEHLWPELDQPWRLDPIAPDDPEEPGRASLLGSRAELIGQRFLEELKERRRRVLRARGDDPAALRIQLLLADRELVLASASTPITVPSGALWPSRFPAGRPPIEEDRAAPSRAYRKLEEALAWMDLAIERRQRCVDLGAAPGSWSYVALARGAQVVAVDRADLDPRLTADSKLTHLRRDALGFEPDSPPVDWLFSDVIAAPKKTLQLLARWLEAGWFRRAIVQLKFKGADRAPAIAEARRLCAEHRRSVRIKHLHFDKNEVTVMIS